MGESTFKIGMESRFIEDIGLDSLDIVELIMAVEEEFNMEILDEEAEQMFKVSDMVNNIVSKYENLDSSRDYQISYRIGMDNLNL